MLVEILPADIDLFREHTYRNSLEIIFFKKRAQIDMTNLKYVI